MIILGTGAGVIQPSENLLFNNNPPLDLIVLGVTNQSATAVDVAAGETLFGNGGQARAEASDGLVSSLFTFNGLANQSLGIELVNPAKAFTQSEFRVFVGRGTATNLTLTAYDTHGQQFQSTFAIPSNGFFFVNAIDGQQIDRFSLSANGSFEDLRQVRIGGVANLVAVPEPASWAMMIAGFGGVGALMRRRRALSIAR